MTDAEYGNERLDNIERRLSEMNVFISNVKNSTTQYKAEIEMKLQYLIKVVNDLNNKINGVDLNNKENKIQLKENEKYIGNILTSLKELQRINDGLHISNGLNIAEEVRRFFEQYPYP
ncbi:MAG: hypothetical protein LBR15_03590, partial [Methanobrevibacter sp.]|nr:hypothetical protein [Candidatus Methanovirga australis]